MPPTRYKPATPAIQWPQNYALNRKATAVGRNILFIKSFNNFVLYEVITKSRELLHLFRCTEWPKRCLNYFILYFNNRLTNFWPTQYKYITHSFFLC